ncbi:MAG: hypothetical protein WCG29_06485 [Desulfomonile sp.]|nr:hypothetical protein [Deltaproteobacteria bacterium]
MRNSRLTKTLIFCVTALFLLVSAMALAADKQWFVIKDSKGVCSVRQLQGTSPKTIAGPFATKVEATKAKEEKCPKPAPGKKEPAKKQP